MLQESSSTAWDPRAMHSVPSAIFKIYLLFLMTVSVVAFFKMMLVWRTAPPFRTARQKDDPKYLPLLKSTVQSFSYWKSLTYLGWWIFASISLYQLCNRLLDDRRVGDLLVVFLLREFSTTFTMALLVALLVHLLQWNLQKRIEKLDRS